MLDGEEFFSFKELRQSIVDILGINPLQIFRAFSVFFVEDEKGERKRFNTPMRTDYVGGRIQEGSINKLIKTFNSFIGKPIVMLANNEFEAARMLKLLGIIRKKRDSGNGDYELSEVKLSITYDDIYIKPFVLVPVEAMMDTLPQWLMDKEKIGVIEEGPVEVEKKSD